MSCVLAILDTLSVQSLRGAGGGGGGGINPTVLLRKLKFRETNRLPKVTQLVDGRAGICLRPCLCKPQPGYPIWGLPPCSSRGAGGRIGLFSPQTSSSRIHCLNVASNNVEPVMKMWHLVRVAGNPRAGARWQVVSRLQDLGPQRAWAREPAG